MKQPDLVVFMHTQGKTSWVYFQFVFWRHQERHQGKEPNLLAVLNIGIFYTRKNKMHLNSYGIKFITIYMRLPNLGYVSVIKDWCYISWSKVVSKLNWNVFRNRKFVSNVINLLCERQWSLNFPLWPDYDSPSSLWKSTITSVKQKRILMTSVKCCHLEWKQHYLFVISLHLIFMQIMKSFQW